jgi:hypothetical protein
MEYAIYQLTGDASRIQQVINYFSLRADVEHSSTKIDVQVDEDEEDEIQDYCDSLGVHYREL